MTAPSNDELFPQRKHLVHGVLHIDGQPTIIFDSICTKNREPWLATAEVHQQLREVWTEASAWLMGRYMIMPDHIHYFAAATDSPIEYENWVKYWKSQFTKKHRVPDHRWQTEHWDTRVRSAERYIEKWEYVCLNPVRKGLVKKSEDWPYQGQIHWLPWD